MNKYWFNKKRGNWKPISLKGWLFLVIFAVLVGLISYYFLINYSGMNLWFGLGIFLLILIVVFNKIAVKKTKK